MRLIFYARKRLQLVPGDRRPAADIHHTRLYAEAGQCFFHQQIRVVCQLLFHALFIRGLLLAEKGSEGGISVARLAFARSGRYEAGRWHPPQLRRGARRPFSQGSPASFRALLHRGSCCSCTGAEASSSCGTLRLPAAAVYPRARPPQERTARGRPRAPPCVADAVCRDTCRRSRRDSMTGFSSSFSSVR